VSPLLSLRRRPSRPSSNRATRKECVEMSERTFHVEVAMTKWIEVKVDDGDFEDAAELEEFVETDALENFGNSERIVEDDYQIETVKEIVQP
jgi:hypothetical protein